MRLASCLLGSALLVGCYRSHVREGVDGGRDAGGGGGADASASRDAGTDAAPSPDGGPYWIPIEIERAEISFERCELRAGQTPIFRIRFFANVCDEPGNVRWSVDHASRTVTLDPFVWRPAGVPPCPPAAIEIVRDVALSGVVLEPGEWQVVGPDAVAVTFTVSAGPPELTCTDCRAAGEACIVDEECAGPRACVAVRGDAICRTECDAPCQPFPGGDAALDLACSERVGPATCTSDPNLGWICRDTTRVLCPPCGPGMRCEKVSGDLARCAWDLNPFEAGSPCTTDGDCRPGMSCVELPTGRTCRIRCRGDHPCPLAVCGPDDRVCPIPKI